MAVPGPITLNSLTAGVASLAANYTQTNPAESDRLYIQFKASVNIEWVTIEVFGETDFTVWNLGSMTSYDCRIRGINDADGFGPWSNTLTQTTLADSFGPPLVSWDEDGVQAGPFVDNTNGSLGSTFDLDSQFGPGSGLSNQTRNGRAVWQNAGGGGGEGLSVTPFPPATTIPQPCTVYAALTVFFVDGNLRYLLKGGFDDIEIRWDTGGFALSKNGTGIYGVGIPAADGRLYVLECVMNNTGSSLRVLDDQGNDTGASTGSVGSSAGIRPESLSWTLNQTANVDGVGQYMEVAVYAGVGTSGERNARIQELFQKWEFDAPDLIPYTTGDTVVNVDESTTGADGGLNFSGDVATLTDDTTSAIEGAPALAGDVGNTLDDTTSATVGTIELGGGVNTTTADVLTTITGTVETPPPPPVVPPVSPNFQRMYSHVLPVGEAFKLQ